MADVRIRVIGEDQASGVLSKIDAGMINLAATFSVVMQAAKMVTDAFQKIWSAAKEGAELELVEERFNRLAESIGTTGDALINELKPAMGGMLSDAEMMASAVDLMALGLVKTQDEAIRLATVAGQLNMNMNQLVLTLTNMTTMRFDALGISVDGFKEKVEELEAAGMSANEAFKEAFLQQAEEQLMRVGSAVDSSVGSLMRLESEWKNIANTAKTAVADMVVSLIDHAEATELVNEAIQKGVLEWDEWRAMMDLVKDGQIRFSYAVDVVRDKLDEAGDALMGYASIYEILDKAEEQYIITEEKHQQLLLDIADGTREVKDVVAELVPWLIDYDGKLILINDRYEQYSRGVKQATSDTKEFKTELEQLADAMTKTEGGDLYIGGVAENREMINSLTEDWEKAAEAAEAYQEATIATMQSALEGMTQYARIFEKSVFQQGDALADAAVDFFMSQAQAAADAGQSFQPYIDAVSAIDPALGAAMQSSAEFTAFLNTLNDAAAAGIITYEQAGQAALEMSEMMKASTANVKDVGLGIIWDMYADDVEAGTIAQNKFNAELDKGAYGVDALATALEAAGASTVAIAEAQRLLVANLQEGMSYADAMAATLTELGLAGGEAEEAMTSLKGVDLGPTLADDMAELETLVAEGGIATGEALKDGIEEGLGETGVIDPALFDASAKEFDGLMVKVDELNAKITEEKEFSMDSSDTILQLEQMILDIETFGGWLDTLVANSPYKIEVETTYTSSGTPPGGEGSTIPPAPGTEGGQGNEGVDNPNGGLQTGTAGWKQVPPGFPNDTFMLGLSSGEEYNVKSFGERGGAPGTTVYISNKFYNSIRDSRTAAHLAAYYTAFQMSDFRGQL